MKKNVAYLALGSNIGNKIANIERAYDRLEQAGIIFKQKSSLYSSSPYGFTEQDAFINSVCEITTTLSAQELLKICLRTEDILGRIRQFKFGPRNIDVDILLFNDDKINEQNLIIPHYDMHNRLFILVPLLEIAGEIKIKGQSISDLIAKCHKDQKFPKII